MPHNMISSIQYRDAPEDNSMDLGSDIWLKAREALQSNSELNHETIVGKKITFAREDGTRNLTGEHDENDIMRSPAREKVVSTKKLPTAQVRRERKREIVQPRETRRRSFIFIFCIFCSDFFLFPSFWTNFSLILPKAESSFPTNIKIYLSFFINSV